MNFTLSFLSLSFLRTRESIFWTGAKKSRVKDAAIDRATVKRYQFTNCSEPTMPNLVRPLRWALAITAAAASYLALA